MYPFIRNGQIVFDATPEERERARRTPFPGTGMRVGGPLPQDNQLVVQSSGGFPPQPPGGGQLVASTSLQPSLQFLACCCNWSNDEMSALRLLLVAHDEELELALQVRAQQMRALRAMLTSMPRTMPRPVFHPDVDFIDSDIANRAIVDLMHCFDLGTGLKILSTVIRYRKHPIAHNLTLDINEVMGGGAPFNLSFPETGEVMYVITTSYHVIIAARSGKQKDLPHPTLIGGDDPEAYSAGMVFFQDHRIIRVLINGSGHFKPNHWSSIEVSLMCFNRLPPEAFHPAFAGFEVFRHGGHLMIGGPMPSGGSALVPFQVCNGPELRGTTEATSALARRSQMTDAFNMVKNLTKKVVGGTLFDCLVNVRPNPVLFALMTPQMRTTYNALMQLMRNTPVHARRGVLGPNGVYQALVTNLLNRLIEIANRAK